MRLREGTHVVLLRGVRTEPAGARGIVKRSTRAVVIVAFDDGRTLPVSLDNLGNDAKATPKEGSSAE